MAEARTRPSHSSAFYSRLVGLSILAAVCLVQVLNLGHLDTPWRRDWFDLLQRLSPRERVSTPAYVVVIDERSIDEYGQWPWPRDRMATLTYNLSVEGKVSAIAFDVIFAEQDRLSPSGWADEIELWDPDLADKLRELGDTDAAFREQITAAPVVLPIAGVDRARPGICQPAGEGAEQGRAMPRAPPEILVQLDCHQHRAGKGPLFDDVASGLAALNFLDYPDGVVRRVPAFQRIGVYAPEPEEGLETGRPANLSPVSVESSVFALLGVEALRVGTKAPRIDIELEPHGGEAEMGALEFPIEADGSFWLRFGAFDRTRYISARDVMDGQSDLSFLNGKIAFVAVAGVGTLDERITPLRDSVPGVEVHLQVLEQIVDQDFLRRPGFLVWIELGLLIAAGALVIWLAPTRAAAIGFAASLVWILCLFAGGWLAFNSGLLLDMATPGIGLLAVSAGVQTVSLVETNIARVRARDALEFEKSARERERLIATLEIELAEQRAKKLEDEMSAAAEIQMGLLPRADGVIDARLDLACYIKPAWQVGGDFYDHFMIDENRMFISVADVSGKGVRASLFMAVSKSIWKSVALQHPDRLESIQAEANSEIARDNTEAMFVTAVAGVLDLATFDLRYSCAGHDAPVLFRDGQAPSQLDAFSGPPVGLVEGMDFPAGDYRLAPGDSLCLFTDGVTEAMNEDRDLFGLERLIDALGDAPTGATSRDVVEHVVARIAEFTGDAEQSDDLTLMIIRLPGAQA